MAKRKWGRWILLGLVALPATGIWILLNPSKPVAIKGGGTYIPTTAFSVSPAKIDIPIPGGRFVWPEKWHTLTPGTQPSLLCGYLNVHTKAIPDAYFIVGGMKIPANQTHASRRGSSTVADLIDLPYATDPKYESVELYCNGQISKVKLPVRPLPGKPVNSKHILKAGPYRVTVHAEWPRLSYAPMVLTLTSNAPPEQSILLRGNSKHPDVAWLIEGGRPTHVRLSRFSSIPRITGEIILLKSGPIELMAKLTRKHGFWLLDPNDHVVHGKGLAVLHGLGYEAIDFRGRWIGEGPVHRSVVQTDTFESLIDGEVDQGTMYTATEKSDFHLELVSPPIYSPSIMEVIHEPEDLTSQRVFNPYEVPNS